MKFFDKTSGDGLSVKSITNISRVWGVLPTLGALCLGLSLPTAQAAPASPDLVVVKQPDGSKLQVFPRGDEWFNWLQTPAGAVVVQDKKTKAYVYAQPMAGGGVAPTTRKAGLGMASAQFVPVAPAGASVLRQQASGTAVSGAISAGGTARVLTILVTYSDKNNSVPASYFSNLLFGTGTGTMTALYTEMSRGAFTVAAGPAGVIGWYRAPGTYASYGGPFPGSAPLAAQLVKDAVQIADAAGVDFGPYDQDGDGYVDVVNVVHQGNGQETSAVVNDIWSHRWDLNSSGVGAQATNDGVTVNDYIMNAETVGGAQNTVGVFAHEYGHALGLPDLYDTDGSSEGIGNWSLMAGGSYNRVSPNPSGTSPAHMDAWCKIQLGWVTPTDITANSLGVSVANVENSGTVFKIRDASFGAKEYFLVENRQPVGFDAGLNGFGLAIWHVDDNVPSNTNEFNNSEWYPGYTTTGHYGLALEQADGYFDLDKNVDRGDNSDLWPGSLGKTTFDQNSAPNSRSYSGASTFLAIKNISASAATMTADFLLTSNTNTVALVAPAQSASVSGSVALSATTSNNAAFTRMDFAYRKAPVQLTRAPGTAILDNSTVTDTGTVSATGTVSQARLSLDISHTYIGDLTVVLIAPDGSRTAIHSNTGTADELVQTYDLTTALAGKALNGNWKLEVRDSAAQDEGTLNSWSLLFNDSAWTSLGADTNGADGSGRWTSSWNTSGLSIGSYEVRAVGTGTDSTTAQDVNAVNVTVSASNQTPTSLSVNPSSGTSQSSVARPLNVVYSDPNGNGDISQARVLIAASANGTGALYGVYDAILNKLYLYNDAGSSISNGYAPGSANVIPNSQGTLNCAATTVSRSGNTLTVGWNFTPNGFFVGAKTIYGRVSDKAGATQGLKALGSWDIALNAGNDRPLLQSLAPKSATSNSSEARTFIFTYADPDGQNDITQTRVVVGANAAKENALYAFYDALANKLYLYDDNGTKMVGGFAPGSANVITNSQGALNCAQTTVVRAENSITVGWNFTPNGFFLGTKRVYGYVRDCSLSYDGFRSLGTWTIEKNPTNDAPLNRSLSAPSTGAVGQASNFNALYGDPDGVANIAQARILINASLRGAQALYGFYDRVANKLYLYNDAGDALVGGFAPGSNNSISNAQGTLNCAQTTVLTSSVNLRVNWNFTPKTAFTGSKKAFLFVRDAANANDGFDQMATWNVTAPSPAPASGTATSAGSS